MRASLHSTVLIITTLTSIASPVFAEEASDASPTYRMSYQDGFQLQSSDANYLLRLQGHLQARYTYNFLKDAEDTHTFAVQRGELRMEGNVYRPTLTYALEMSLSTRNAATTTAVCTNAACTTTANAITTASNSGIATLNDYFLDWQPIRAIGVRAGQFKVPFLLQELTSPMKQQFVDHALATDTFTLARDVGVNLHGALFDSHLRYAVFAMNGDGANSLNRNKSFMIGTRVDVAILGEYAPTESDVGESDTPQLGIGAAYVFNRPNAALQNSTLPAGVRASLATVDAGFKYRGFSANASGLYGHSYGGTNLTNWGFNGQAGYCILPHRLEIAARVDGVHFGNGTPSQYEYSGGVNYYVRGHNLKIQTDYALLHNLRGSGVTDHRIRTQWQVIF